MSIFRDYISTKLRNSIIYPSPYISDSSTEPSRCQDIVVAPYENLWAVITYPCPKIKHFIEYDPGLYMAYSQNPAIRHAKR